MKQKTNISVRNNLGYHITSEMELGPNNGYSSGDILDANAVEQLIEDKINSLVGGATTSADTLKELEDKITQLAMSQITNDAGYVQQDADGQLKVNETNITNTINKIIVSNQPFPSTWPTDNQSSFSDLITSIDGDEDAIKGKVYLSTIHYTDLPANMGDAELKVEIMDDSNPLHKIAVFSITSANVSPYNWHATMWGGELTEWRSYALATEPDTPSPTPIPVSGDIQLFADNQCTSYPQGSLRTVYARINTPWGFNEAWQVIGHGFDLVANAPSTSAPTDTYSITLSKDGLLFGSDDLDNLSAGMIVPLTETFGSDVPDDFFDGNALVFTKP